jgi:hypothetical protein
MISNCYKIIAALSLLAGLSSCAYIRERKIDVPVDIAQKAQVEMLPETQQKDEKELILKINLLNEQLKKLQSTHNFESIVPLTQDIALSFILPGRFPVVQMENKDGNKEEDKDKSTEVTKEKETKIPEKVKAAGTVTKPAERTATAKTRIVTNPFRIGESITLRLEYLGLTAAYLKIETMPYVLLNSKKAFHFRGSLDTSMLMNILYKAHDTLDEYIDYQNFVPLKEEVHLNETKQNMEQFVIYDHKDKKAIFWKKKIDKNDKLTEERRVDEFAEYALDVPSTVYFIRTQNLQVGDKLETVVYDNGKLWELTVDVLRTELLNTGIGKVETLLLRPSLKLGGQPQQKGELLLWITNDDRKIPVRFRAKAKIGSIEGEITELIRN